MFLGPRHNFEVALIIRSDGQYARQRDHAQNQGELPTVTCRSVRGP